MKKLSKRILEQYRVGLGPTWNYIMSRKDIADEVALFEQSTEAAKRAIAIIYDVGYATIPTAIDLEEAIDRLEEANETE